MKIQYIAKDGKVFDNKVDCENYEYKLNPWAEDIYYFSNDKDDFLEGLVTLEDMNKYKLKCVSPTDVRCKLNKCDLIYFATMHSAIKAASENYDTECPNDKGLSIWDGYHWQTALEYSKELQDKANALITKANNLMKLEDLIKQDLEER